MSISANDDGTVTFAGRDLDGNQVAELVTALLGAMIEATRKSGRMEAAKSQAPLGKVHAIQPSMVQIRKIDQDPGLLVVLTCGMAQLGVAIPQPILRELARGLLTEMPPDKFAH